MRTIDTLAWLSTVTGSAGLVFGSVLSKLPEWFAGALSSTCGAKFARRAAHDADDEPGSAADDETESVSPASDNTGSLVDTMLAQGRYTLLLRPQLIGNLSGEQLARTQAAVADQMALVPPGKVVLRHCGEGLFDGSQRAAEMQAALVVEAYYLDRYPVTNGQFFQFVANGGYEQMSIWHQEIWPAVLDFVDQSGHPGPRFWHKGRYLRGQEKYPVVGVSWYEAAAYARWVGKRLPSDAEWIKAGSWPVSIPGQPPLQRRYPWGEAMDHTRANLWGTGLARVVGVDQFAGGVSVGGIHQLIGNVWEWTADAFALDDDADHDASAPTMKSIRGGAYDTYLDQQATCDFQTGDAALARKHNIGFRCAIGVCDLSRRPEAPATAEADADAETTLPLVETRT